MLLPRSLARSRYSCLDDQPSPWASHPRSSSSSSPFSSLLLECGQWQDVGWVCLSTSASRSSGTFPDSSTPFTLSTSTTTAASRRTRVSCRPTARQASPPTTSRTSRRATRATARLSLRLPARSGFSTENRFRSWNLWGTTCDGRWEMVGIRNGTGSWSREGDTSCFTDE
ncbi:hypothetical protein TCAP_02707 [Tolypocladium capitatum]|uniref:Uncharacterized protein n=1 Tax=Tolypocladium capitatum TaxID=45235 RepID=A0A2K3QIL5_9HYPO|nr:hypothetical protein TCAP_02707 [Tolypocladium capitatum]